MVGHRDFDLRVVATQRKLDASAARHVLGRVANQVPQRALELHRIDVREPRPRARLFENAVVAVPLQQGHLLGQNALCQHAQFSRCAVQAHAAVLVAVHVEQLDDEIEHPARIAVRHL